MLIKKPDDIKSSEITKEKHYLNRRTFLRGAVIVVTTTATGLLYRALNPANQRATSTIESPKTNTGSAASVEEDVVPGIGTYCYRRCRPLRDCTRSSTDRRQ